MMIRFFSMLLLTCLLPAALASQVKISSAESAPAPSSMLEVESTSRGFLPPRMTAAERDAVSNPADGLMIFNTTTGCPNYYHAGIWYEWCGMLPPGAIALLDCAGASHAGFLTGNAAASGVSSTVSYTGGNGGTHSGQTVSSTGVAGLTAILTAGEFALGSGTLTYTITGTPTGGGTASFALNIGGQTCTLTRQVSAPPALGSTFTSFSNGTQVFSSNTTCQSKLISAGHTPATCSGTVTTANATYPVVLINGQCWMAENLKEPSTTPCGAAINTGCNTWLSTSPGNIGSWGYYNTVTTNGSAGWATAEAGSGDGLLYQWSAAMNGSTAERSRGVCPPGWHIPSDCEWMYLEHGLGMSTSEQTTTGFRNSGSVGNKLSSFASAGTNSSGFTGLLSGLRNATGGAFSTRSASGFWWTSTEISSSDVYRRFLSGSQNGFDRFSGNKAFGFSVRCLKD
jgi:uncharacterized protein (TIGR02145 family)